MLLRFLFEFALPWLGFRQSTREGDSRQMDSMYAVTSGWFRATQKRLYARICVDYIWVVLAMHPSLASVWAKYRTCSLLGNSGRDIAWDQANEFMNLAVKSMGPKDASRIDSIMMMLNGLNSADANLRGSLATERVAPTEYTQVKAAHVEKMLRC